MAGKRLWTEADVRALARGARLVLGADALATPAALDACFQRGVQVVWGAGQSATSAAASGDALQRLLANDGTYVLQVAGGRAVVTRLGEAGPVPFGRLP